MKAVTLYQRTRRWRALAAVVLLLTAFAAWNWQGITIWYTMVPIRGVDELPTFDARKAQGLSAERRAELERELFSELRMWNGGSRRYGPPNGRAERQQRWVEMAQEGSELAYLTFKVLPPDSFARDPRPTLKRLEEMAQQGNAAAMCLYGGIVFQLPFGVVDWKPQQERARYWTEKGAALGHPQCLIALGGWTMAGDMRPKDMKRGMNMVFEAIRKGYDHGASALWLPARELNFVDAASRKLEYCWAYNDAKYASYSADLAYRNNVNKASPEHRLNLQRELNELRQWHPSIEDCIQLTQQLFGE
jgi:hypothetical protein